ncbi:MAG: CRISPR-associated endonuclease Cas3'' [Nitrososphaerota archaeon]
MGMKNALPYAYKDHPLIDHMKACLELIEQFTINNPSYLNIVSVRLLKSGLNKVDQKSIENMLKLGATIHDIGKAYKYYQEKLEKHGGGFEYHEVFSTVSCYKILLSSDFSLEDQKLGVLLLMAILNHHQAFREDIPLILMDVNSFIRKRLIHIVRKGLCDNVSSLESVLSVFGLTIRDVFVNDQQEFQRLLNNIASMLRFYLKKKFDENRRWLRLYTLFMLPIVLVDNLDAHERRGGVSSFLLINEFKKFMEV